MTELLVRPSAPLEGAAGRRYSYGRIPEMLTVGDLIQTQINSFDWFKREGLK